MKANNYITDAEVRQRWEKLTEKQQKQLNDAYKRSTVALTNMEQYINKDKAPAVITNKRDKRLWPEMNAAQRKRALMQIRDYALMGANIAGAITGED